MGEHSFDELARGLASGSVSRRKALRLMGAALVGGALASIPGVAWGEPPSGGLDCPAGRTRCTSGGSNSVCCRCSERNPRCPSGTTCSCCGTRHAFDQGPQECICCPTGQICLRGASLPFCASP
jgi:hypothetical protein